MGLLFKIRPRSTDIGGTNDLENYGLSQIGVNSDAIKVYDDPKVPLDFIRAAIVENTPASKIRFLYDHPIATLPHNGSSNQI